MSDMSRQLRRQTLRRAVGYLELAGLGVEADAPVAAPVRTLLERALAEIDRLPEADRAGPDEILITGEALRMLGRWEEALDALGQAAAAAPGQVEAWLGMGWCLKRLGRLGEAIAALEHGLAAAPRQPILLYNLACYHSLAGNVPTAIEHLTKAIALDARYRDLTGSEKDFDPIRSDPRFVAATHAIV